MGSFSVKYPIPVAIAFIAVLVGGVYGAQNLEVNRSAINNFKADEPIRLADAEINSRFNGTTYLDIVVEGDAPGALYDPYNLKKIEALQDYLKTVPHIGGSVSIVDYLKPLHQAINSGDEAYFNIPDDSDLIEQVFLVHSASGDPTEFEEEVDTEFQTALIRVSLKTGLFSEISGTVQTVETYLQDQFNDEYIKASLSGRAALDHNWLSPLRANHFLSLFVSLILIWVAAYALLRSLVAATITVLPVLTAILMIYAVMGTAGIWLQPATSMFAPIAIGLGVDFSIHVIERLQYYVRHKRMFLMQAVVNMSKVSGRALFFNFASIFLGFGVLTFSELPMLTRFGGLTMTALLASYLTAIILIPALVTLLNTDRVFRRLKNPIPNMTMVLVLGLGLGMGYTTQGRAEDDKNGQWYAEMVANRAEPDNIQQTLKMTLIDRKGRSKERLAKMIRKTVEEERRTVIAFSQPRGVKDTAFMTHDYAAAEREDNQWLYVPALRRSRRISSSDRGDYFLGTDFTYEDIKDSTKFSLHDYIFEKDGTVMEDGVEYQVLKLTPKSEDIAKELGYSKVQVVLNTENWMPHRARYWDIAGNALKTIHLGEQKKVDGFWTAVKITAENHKTDHKTIFEITDINYKDELALAMFTERALRGGL